MVMMMMMMATTCETSGSHSGVGEDSVLECDAVKNGKHLTNFTTMVVPSNPRTSVLGLRDPEITEFPVLRDGGYCLLIGRAQYHRHTVSLRVELVIIIIVVIDTGMFIVVHCCTLLC